MKNIIYLFMYLLIFLILFVISFYGVITGKLVFRFNEAFPGTDLFVLLISVIGVLKTIWHIINY
ncbi:MAG: hypothetical protein ACQESF_05355 [Nanobdellota archaeon]